jgi:hypothetical protein
LKTASLEVFQAQAVVPADFGLTHGYGIGFEVERREKLRRLRTRRSGAGYTAALVMNRKAGIGVIVLSNGAVNPTSVADRALDILSK